MNPVVGTAVLLLVVLMSTSASAGSLQVVCATKFPAIPCKGKSGWFQLGKTRCVKAFANPKGLMFHDAERVCKNVGNGHLVSIHTHEEWVQVMCTMFRASRRKFQYWIGLRKLNNVFTWIDGTKGTLKRYAKGQPNNYQSRQDCVEMNFFRWGLWNDEYCGSKRPFVCGVQL